MSSTYTKLLQLNHWTVQKGVDDAKYIVYNMHDILNQSIRVVDPVFQAMYDRLMVLLRSVSNVPVQKRVFTWENVRAVLGDNDYTVIASHLAGDLWTEQQCQIAALIVYREQCEEHEWLVL